MLRPRCAPAVVGHPPLLVRKRLRIGSMPSRPPTKRASRAPTTIKPSEAWVARGLERKWLRTSWPRHANAPLARANAPPWLTQTHPVTTAGRRITTGPVAHTRWPPTPTRTNAHPNSGTHAASCGPDKAPAGYRHDPNRGACHVRTPNANHANAHVYRRTPSRKAHTSHRQHTLTLPLTDHAAPPPRAVEALRGTAAFRGGARTHQRPHPTHRRGRRQLTTTTWRLS